MKKFYQGFTLIELMIVVAIIGVLAATIIQIWQGYQAKQEAFRKVAETHGLGAYELEDMSSIRLPSATPDTKISLDSCDDLEQLQTIIGPTVIGEYLRIYTCFNSDDGVVRVLQVRNMDNDQEIPKSLENEKCNLPDERTIFLPSARLANDTTKQYAPMFICLPANS